MICPYCGREVSKATKEHFFPKSIHSNEFDFYACKECNHLKRSHIVYPSSDLFEVLPLELNKNKFYALWSLSAYGKYTQLVPWRHMRKIFKRTATYSEKYEFSVEERLFYRFDYLREVINYVEFISETDEHIRALVLPYETTNMFLLHTYQNEFPTPYKNVRSMRVDRFLNTGYTGMRVTGSGADYIWQVTNDYREYFKVLLNS